MSNNNPNLTPRELEVLAYLTAGTSNREIATELHISVSHSEGSPKHHLREAPCVKPNRGGAHRLRCLPDAEGLRELAWRGRMIRATTWSELGRASDPRLEDAPATHGRGNRVSSRFSRVSLVLTARPYARHLESPRERGVWMGLLAPQGISSKDSRSTSSETGSM